jgi:hypothetical protein
MVLHSAYAPVLPEMDPFLFASVGEEIGGIPLSVLSALAQLGLDPRNEAARLSKLTSEAAASQLGGLFARIPDHPWTASEIRRIASTLVELLPAAQNGGNKNNPITSAARSKLSPIASGHLIYLALALSGALAFGLLAHGFVASDNREATSPLPLVNSLSQSSPIR